MDAWQRIEGVLVEGLTDGIGENGRRVRGECDVDGGEGRLKHRDGIRGCR